VRHRRGILCVCNKINILKNLLGPMVNLITERKETKDYSFNSYHMWLTCRNLFGNVLYSVLMQENALYT